MKKISKIKIIFTILGVAVFSSVFLFGNTAKAASPLEVEFQNEPQPLFYEVNFLPNQSVTGWIKVTNKSGKVQKIVTEAVNYPNQISSTDLSQALMIVIKKGTKELYGGSADPKILSAFYLDSGKPSPEDDEEIYLSDLENDETVQYDITISFPAEKGNEWQNKTTSFDLAIGFQGTEEERTTTTGTILGAAIAPSEETIPQTLGRILGAAITKTGGSIAFVLLLSFLIASTCYLIYLKERSKKNKENCDI